MISKQISDTEDEDMNICTRNYRFSGIPVCMLNIERARAHQTRTLLMHPVFIMESDNLGPELKKQARETSLL